MLFSEASPQAGRCLSVDGYCILTPGASSSRATLDPPSGLPGRTRSAFCEVVPVSLDSCIWEMSFLRNRYAVYGWPTSIDGADRIGTRAGLWLHGATCRIRSSEFSEKIFRKSPPKRLIDNVFSFRIWAGGFWASYLLPLKRWDFLEFAIRDLPEVRFLSLLFVRLFLSS